MYLSGVCRFVWLSWVAGGTEGAVQQGPVRARVLNDLSAEEKERYKADIRATNILLQELFGTRMWTMSFEANDCECIRLDVGRGSRSQRTMYRTKLNIGRLKSTMKAGTSYVSNTLSRYISRYHCKIHLDEYPEVHEMQTDEQHNYVVDSDADYTSNSNIVLYDQYMEDNEDHVVQRNVSSDQNDSIDDILD
ncbi:retrovirus-related pol polyprotein from transposon TNT 1-94 [Tanacetum coccineum]